MKKSQILALVAASLCAGLTNAQVTHDVIVGPKGEFVFMPEDLTIEVGDSVHWVWDSSGHNVESGTPALPNPAFFSGDPAPAGTQFSVTFDQAFLDANPMPGNLFVYHCDPHASFGMFGTITVTAARLCADQNGDGFVTPTDFTAWIANFNAGDFLADVNQDGLVTPTDFTAWIAAFNQGANGPTCTP